MFAAILTGAPGAGKSVALMALSDALVVDQMRHAAVDVDEIAWAYPYPTLAERCDHLRAWTERCRSAGFERLLVGEAIESPGHRRDLLAALGAEDHLLVRLTAAPSTLHERILAREPPGWSGLTHLLDEAPRLHASLAALDGVHLVLDTERASPGEIAEQVRAARPDALRRGGLGVHPEPG